MNFPESKIMEHMQKKAKTKRVIAVSKENLLKFKSLFVDRGKKKKLKNHSTQLPCRWRDGRGQGGW